MPHDLLQYWGGGFYLLNKIFFSRTERNTGERSRIWRVLSWTVYLIGLPAWVWILVSTNRWMAAAVEAGGGLLMVLGLVVAVTAVKAAPPVIKELAKALAYILIGMSVYHSFSGTDWIIQTTQVFEIGVTTGFLVGTMLLGLRKPAGYLWFVLMNVSMALLQYWDNNMFLFWQQVISIGFVLDAFLIERRNRQ